MKKKPVKTNSQPAGKAVVETGAETNMLLEQQQFNDVLEMLPCYLILLSPDYHVVFANKFFRERFGESHGKRCFEYLFNRTEPCEVCETYKVLKKMKPLEWEWVGPDGHNYYIYDFPFKNVDGSIFIMEVGIDITVQKQALADLGKARDELEQRVQERTRELKEVNRLLRIKATEHKQAEEREKVVAEEWQATFDSITDMVSIQDKDCRLVRVNKAYADAVGMRLEDLNGQKCYAVIHQTDCAIENCPHLETIKTCKSVTREIFEPRLGLYLEVTTSPVFNQAGELTASVHIAKDITERKKAEEALKVTLARLNKSSRQTSALLNASKAVLKYEKFADSARAIFDACRDVIGATGGYVALLAENGKENEVLFLESGGRPCTVDPKLPMPIRGLRAEAYLSGKAVYDNDFPNSKWARLLPAGHVAIDNVLFAPLVIDSKTVGLIGLADKPGGFTQDDAELATAFSGLASVALQNSRTMDSLQNERDKLTGILDSMEDGVYIVSRNGDIEYANPSLKAEFGPIEGIKCYSYLHNRPTVCPWCNNEEIFSGRTVHWELYLPKPGKTYDLVDTPIKNPDGSISKLEIFHDITELKRVAHLKDEFIGLVSHELRTPLTVITGSLRTAMSEGLSPDEARELLNNAIEGADQLASILENMLELSRYQAGRLTLHVEPVSLTGTTRNVIKKLKDQGAAHQFIMDIPLELPPVEADPTRVERILYNLLENATKYCPANTRITISARTDGNFIVTRITDQGPGISAEDQVKLFELFQQLETSHPGSSGVGLGLVVCKRLVEAQGGWIKIDSAPGKGSTFSFALPKSKLPS